MKKLNFFYILIFLFIILLFLNYNLVLKSSIEAVNIWLTKVFPFLFIMITITDILINLNFEKNFKNTTSFIIILSLLSGAPSNAYIISNLVKQNKISIDTANKSLLFTYFANPLFMYNLFSTLFNNYIALKLILIHYISNIIIYLFIHKKIINNPINSNKKPIFNIGNSLKKSMNTLTMILGTITFYMVLTNIITNFFNCKEITTLLIKSFLEVTQGLNYLLKINISLKTKELIASFFISFAGLAIHTQVKTILDEENLNYKYFLKGRIMQGIISLLFTAIF